MKATWRRASVALSLAGVAVGWPAAGAAPTVSLAVNAPVEREGDTHILTVTASVPEAVLGDVYFVVQLPTGELFSLVGTGFVPGLVPYLTGFAIPAGFSVTDLELLRFVLPALPVGTYTWKGGIALPGTLVPISNVAEAAWTFTDSPVPAADWLTQVNFWRRSGNVPELTEDLALSQGDLLHATYVVKTDDFAHSENPGSPYYTDAGNLAAQRSNGAASTDATAPDAFAIESWLQAPFHSVGVLDPRLATTGFGSFREAGPVYQMSGWLDVLSDRSAPPSYPVYWPGDGRTIPVPNADLCPAGQACFWGETPSPLTSCPGYTTPAGLPLVILLGTGSAIGPADDPSDIGPSSLLRGGLPLEHCLVSELDYVNPDASSQALGRNILGSRDAVILIPRDPLPAGGYDVSVTVKGTVHAWSFTVDPGLQPSRPGARPSWADGAVPPAFDVR